HLPPPPFLLSSFPPSSLSSLPPLSSFSLFFFPLLFSFFSPSFSFSSFLPPFLLLLFPPPLLPFSFLPFFSLLPLPLSFSPFPSPFLSSSPFFLPFTFIHFIYTLYLILLKLNYLFFIISPNYLPYEYENESNQKYFELIENQQELNVELVQKQSFNPKPPGVDVSYMVTPYGIKLWAVKKNIIEGDQFYMHIQTASGEIPVDSQEITGDGTANAPYTYQWTQSSPWTNFTGQTYEVEFIFYGGVYG
ncbi:conserved hypothetical protein, membrane, partial [Candidatus Magnetomorum sp. HK-1]